MAILKGLCSECHKVAKKMVDDGETTWPQLQEMGLVDGPKKAAINPFREAFNQKRS